MHATKDHYDLLCKSNAENKAFVKMKAALMKEIDKERREIKLEHLKIREEKLMKEIAEKNRIRMAKKEKVVAMEGRRMTSRSPPLPLKNLKE